LRLLFVTFCSTFIICVGATYAIVEESDAPFIYYYSPSERAIIIERADGADRWTLMKEMFAPENRGINYLRWSPSGRWLLWTAVEYHSEINYTGTKSWALRYDLSELREDAFSSSNWSPVEDIYIHIDYGDSSPVQIVSIVEFETQHVRMSFELEDDLRLSNIFWASDGTFVYFTEADTNREDIAHFVTVSLSGERKSHEFLVLDNSQSSWRADIRNDIWTWSSNIFYQEPRLVYTHPERQTIVIEDLNSGDIREIEPRQPPLISVKWSHDWNYALIATQSQQLALNDYNRNSQVLMYAYQDNVFSVIADDRVGLPREAWTHDNRGFLLRFVVNDYYETRLYRFSDSVYRIVMEPLLAAPDLTMQIVDENDEVFFLNMEYQTLVYDAQHVRVLQAFSALSGRAVSWSPNGQYLAHSSLEHYGEGRKYILDRLTGEKFEFPFHTNIRQGYANWVTESVWDSGGEWVRYREIPGQGVEECFFSFGNTVGDAYHEIPDLYNCYEANGYYITYPRWVPDNVPLDDIR
jgi:hypothetical protein